MTAWLPIVVDVTVRVGEQSTKRAKQIIIVTGRLAECGGQERASERPTNQA